MYRPRIAFPAAVLCVLVAAPALADVPYPYVLDYSYAAIHESSILILPDGSGPPLTEARDISGQLVDASITITIGTVYGDPIPGYPFEDVWLQWAQDPETVAGCTSYSGYVGGVFLADATTDVNGLTGFTQPLRGGGWTVGTATIYVNGSPAMYPPDWVLPPIQLRANSPDLNGDLVVNLSDMSYFAQDYGGPYAYRSDFNWDGWIGLTDLVIFVAGIGVECQ